MEHAPTASLRDHPVFSYARERLRSANQTLGRGTVPANGLTVMRPGAPHHPRTALVKKIGRLSE
jgi:hypothetical protein